LRSRPVDDLERWPIDRLIPYAKNSQTHSDAQIAQLAASMKAGGGSIARITRAGLLQVGPESAGACPGPIVYGRGGAAVTVTDANLVLLGHYVYFGSAVLAFALFPLGYLSHALSTARR
jgi:hypothetical protein